MVLSKKVMGVIIIGLMVLSTVALVIVDLAVGPSGSLKYNGFKFQPVSNQFIAKINGEEHRFLFFPGDIEFIQISSEVKALLEKPVLTVAYNPNSSIAQNLAEVQYYFELQLKDDKVIERALTDNTNTELIQKSCSDATDAQPVIYLEQGNVSKLVADGNCIKLTALDPYDLYQQSERIIYHVLGVING